MEIGRRPILLLGEQRIKIGALAWRHIEDDRNGGQLCFAVHGAAVIAWSGQGRERSVNDGKVRLIHLLDDAVSGRSLCKQADRVNRCEEEGENAANCCADDCRWQARWPAIPQRVSNR